MTRNSARDSTNRRSPDRRSVPADFEALAARLDAVERAVATGDETKSSPADSSSRAGDGEGSVNGRDARIEAETGREDEIEALRKRVETLEAELDAVRGLLDGARAVDESVERKADAALAAVERLESLSPDDEGLVVERVPVGELSDGEAATEAERRRDEGETDRTLAARLRGAF